MGFDVSSERQHADWCAAVGGGPCTCDDLSIRLAAEFERLPQVTAQDPLPGAECPCCHERCVSVRLEYNEILQRNQVVFGCRQCGRRCPVNERGGIQTPRGWVVVASERGAPKGEGDAALANR